LASPVDNDSTNSVLNTAAIERLAYGEKPRFEQGLDHVVFQRRNPQHDYPAR
jgi:hypothetical protein